MVKPRRLSEVLEAQAHALVEKWAKENQNKVWLGGPSRKKIAAEIAIELRAAYDRAKRKYKRDV